MQIDILTLFPEMFAGPFASSIIFRAIERGVVTIGMHNLRDWTHDRHRTVDDMPFGGGPGMVLKPEPIFEALDDIGTPGAEIVLFTPNGEVLRQPLVEELAARDHVVLICGHYEGIDERVADHLATRLVSIGDYVLSGGELAAMVVIDSVVRLLPGALGAEDGAADETFTDGLIEHPQYTRPREFRGMSVPDVLLSGNHALIEKWRVAQRKLRTKERRPDLWQAFEERNKK